MKTKVPKEVRDAIRKAAKYREKASLYEDIIETWFDELGVADNDSYRDTFIDYVQQSPFSAEAAIRQFESLTKGLEQNEV